MPDESEIIVVDKDQRRAVITCKECMADLVGLELIQRLEFRLVAGCPKCGEFQHWAINATDLREK